MRALGEWLSADAFGAPRLSFCGEQSPRDQSQETAAFGIFSALSFLCLETGLDRRQLPFCPRLTYARLPFPSLKWERTWVQEPKEPGRVFPGGWAPRMLGAGGRAAPAGALCGAASPTAHSHVHLADGSCSENKTCSLDLLIK